MVTNCLGLYTCAEQVSVLSFCVSSFEAGKRLVIPGDEALDSATVDAAESSHAIMLDGPMAMPMPMKSDRRVQAAYAWCHHPLHMQVARHDHEYPCSADIAH